MEKTALVTGASMGLGKEIAVFLARSGYDVVITARSADTLAETASAYDGSRGKLLPMPGDVADASHRWQLSDFIGGLGGLDILVNNASELGPSPLRSLDDYPIDELRRVFEVNFISPVALIQDLLPALRSKSGLVVNLTSDAAVNAYPRWGGYGASKAALEHASRTLAEELEDIAVVSVDPGDMRTRMHQDAVPGEDISHLPPPEATLPFWAWLFASDRRTLNGRRFLAQADTWEAAS